MKQNDRRAGIRPAATQPQNGKSPPIEAQKNTKIFYDFPDYVPEYLGGAALKVFIDECGQSPKWYASQRKILMSAQTANGLALSALDNCSEELAKEILEFDDEWEDDLINEIAHELINGREDSARALLQEALSV